MTAGDEVSGGDTPPRLKSPVVGPRRLRALVSDELHLPASSGSASCPGSPRDIAHRGGLGLHGLGAAVGRRLQLGLSPRLAARRTATRRRIDVSPQHQQTARQVFSL